MTVDLKKKWALGFNDRGMGRGDYGVIEEPPEDEQTDRTDAVLMEIIVPALIIPQLDREVAEHIIELHNQDLERTNEIESELRR